MDITSLTHHFTMRNKDSAGSVVLINFGGIVSHPGEYWMRTILNLEEPWQKVCILKGRRKLAPPLDIEYPVKYPNGHPINPKKVSDLQTMLPFLLSVVDRV